MRWSRSCAQPRAARTLGKACRSVPSAALPGPAGTARRPWTHSSSSPWVQAPHRRGRASCPRSRVTPRDMSLGLGRGAPLPPPAPKSASERRDRGRTWHAKQASVNAKCRHWSREKGRETCVFRSPGNGVAEWRKDACCWRAGQRRNGVGEPGIPTLREEPIGTTWCANSHVSIGKSRNNTSMSIFPVATAHRGSQRWRRSASLEQGVAVASVRRHARGRTFMATGRPGA